MGFGRDHRSGGSGGVDGANGSRGAGPGKNTLVGSLPVQMRGEAAPSDSASAIPGQAPAPAPGTGAPGPLDPLRAAVKAQNASDISTAYQALSSADKVALAHDTQLVTEVVRLLDPSAALAILTDLAVPRRTLLQVASGGKPSDPAFLIEVLRLAGLGNLTTLAAGAGDVRAFAAFARRDVI